MTNSKKTDLLYLIDGSGYIFRAFYALPPLTRKSKIILGMTGWVCIFLGDLLFHLVWVEDRFVLQILTPSLRTTSNKREH